MTDCLNCQQQERTQIVLHCQHNFCLICISYMVLKSRANGNPFDEVVCAKCGKVSKLDKQSIEQIQQTIQERLIPQLDDPPTVVHKGITFSKNMASVESFDYNTNTPNKGKYKMKEFCQVHLMQEVAFVCMTCDHDPLCLKCILSKKHTDHDIKSFQKAMSVMLQQLDLMQFHVAEGIQLIQFKKRTVKDRKSLVQQCWQKSKRGIQEIFQQLTSALMKKQVCYQTLNLSVQEQVQMLDQNLLKLKHTKQNLKQLSQSQGYFDFLALYNSQKVSIHNQLTLDVVVSVTQQSIINTLHSIGNLEMEIGSIKQQLKTENCESQFQLPPLQKQIPVIKKPPRNSEPPRVQQNKLPQYASKFLQKHSHHTLKQDFHSISKNTFQARSRVQKSRLLEPSGSTSYLNRRKSPLDKLRNQKQLYQHKKSKQF